MVIASTNDFREAARRRLPPFLFHYIDGASYAEVTSANNVADLNQVALRQRVLRDVSEIDLSTNLFGHDYHLPVGLGPVGLSGMFARRGETQAARVTAEKGIAMCLSTVSICSLSEVAAHSAQPLWFQLYMVRDRGFMRNLIHQAKASGCAVLVLTADLPMPGARYRDAHSGMSGRYGAIRRYAQALTHPRWAFDVGLCGRPHQLGNLAPLLGNRSGLADFTGWVARNFDPSVTWSDLGWIRDNWDGPLVIKGILDPDDAREAVKMEANGIVVSNHGGRQLDGALSTTRALPAIADIAGDALTLLADGGVRSGLDVVRLLALGAKGVLLGRAWAYALGAAGGPGVARLLTLIEAEMRIAMALTGTTSIDRIDRSILADWPR
jgi:L-lactate dehydrogenase (cytochrome)